MKRPLRRRERASLEALQGDVRMLGSLLGEALLEYEGKAFFDFEERVRLLSIRRRRGRRAAAKRAGAGLAGLLRGLPADRAESLIRAFSTYFQLVNLAEQHHRIGARREGRAERRRPPEPSLDPGKSFRDCLRQARRGGVTAKQAREALRALRLTLTFTAHPSQAVRRTVLEKLRRIGGELLARDQGSARDGAESRARLQETVATLWLTDAVRREQPRVGDEVKAIAWYVETVLWAAVPEVSATLVRAFEEVYGEPLGFGPAPVRIHAWAGGDMDGNPNVTPEVFEDALRAYLARGLRLLSKEVAKLGQTLSHSDRYISVPPALGASLESDEREMPALAAVQEPRTHGEPFRRKLKFLEARLDAALAEIEHRRAEAFPGSLPVAATSPGASGLPPLSAAQVQGDLGVLAAALSEAAGARSGLSGVTALLDRVRAFGVRLCELELRIAAAEVRAAAAELEAGGRSSRVFGALEALRRAPAEGGEGACRTLILSMAESKDDVLAALRCARACGLWDEGSQSAPLDVVPLFETYEALRSSPEILRGLLADPAYRRHLDARGAQEVMLGYSDSGKEVGLLAAWAALVGAQEQLLAVAREHRVRLRFFHGRGETVARGGAPAQQAVLALPPGSVAGEFKVTEQGEALDHKYASPELAAQTLELYLGGVFLHTLGVQPRPSPKDEPRFREALDALAETSRRAYRALVWEEPRFEAFFQAATPVDEIANLKIGSRPAKRATGLKGLRAIPWVFAWNQTRAILPGWYGVGSALEEYGRSRQGLRLLQRMYRTWPYFAAILDNVEMVLAKVDMGIAALYAELAPMPVREAIWPLIEAEHGRTRRAVLRVTGHKRPLAANPSLERSIERRNAYIDPMSFLQIELLRRKREGERDCDRALALTVAGIASGLRNTG